MTNRRCIARTVPRGSHIVHIGKCSDIARRSNTPHLADVHANKINEPILNKRCPLVRMIKKFAHRQRCGALRAHVVKIRIVFRRESIFQKEKLERLHIFGKLDGVNRAQTLVNIVQKLDFRPDLRTYMRNHIAHATAIFSRVIISTIGRAIGFLNTL